MKEHDVEGNTTGNMKKEKEVRGEFSEKIRNTKSEK